MRGVVVDRPKIVVVARHLAAAPSDLLATVVRVTVKVRLGRSEHRSFTRIRDRICEHDFYRTSIASLRDCLGVDRDALDGPAEIPAFEPRTAVG